MKYQISYTLKNSYHCVIKDEFFKTKKLANEWLKENSTNIYWYQLTETNPESKFYKPIIKFEPGEEFLLKIGTLQTHFETGMECLGLVFYEDGIHGPINPNFDPSKPEDGFNFKNYSSYDGLNFLTHGQILQIEDDEKIAMLKDRDFAKRDGYRLSFYPKGFSRIELIKLFSKGTVKAKLWIKRNEK